MAPPNRRDDPPSDAPDEAGDDLPGVADEPEPEWVEDIRRRRRERAERLKELLEPEGGDPGEPRR